MKTLIENIGIIVILGGIVYLAISVTESFANNQDIMISGVIIGIGLITYIITNKILSNVK